MEIKVLGIEVKTRNERERRLTNIANLQIARMVDYWSSSEEWKSSFTKERTNHWMITGVEGLLDAMFYMDMIKEPIGALEIFEAVEREANEKIAEQAA